MTRPTRPRALVLGVLAVTIAAAAAMRPSASDTAPRTDRARGPLVVAPRTAPPRPTPRPLSQAQAVTVARRFAAAYAAWDAGPRTARAERRLARTATPELVASLHRGPARPTAGPARRLHLVVIATSPRAHDTYLVALGTRDPGGAYVATLAITSTADGPRVARLQH